MRKTQGNDIFSSIKCGPAQDKPNPSSTVYVIQEIAGSKEGRPKINIMGAAIYGSFKFLLPELSQIICAVGLCQNLGALRALASEGIQRGHMGLHARNLAVQAGAKKEEIDKLAEMLKRSGKVRADMAEKFLAEIREK